MRKIAWLLVCVLLLQSIPVEVFASNGTEEIIEELMIEEPINEETIADDSVIEEIDVDEEAASVVDSTVIEVEASSTYHQMYDASGNFYYPFVMIGETNDRSKTYSLYSVSINDMDYTDEFTMQQSSSQVTVSGNLMNIVTPNSSDNLIEVTIKDETGRNYVMNHSFQLQSMQTSYTIEAKETQYLSTESAKTTGIKLLSVPFAVAASDVKVSKVELIDDNGTTQCIKYASSYSDYVYYYEDLRYDNDDIAGKCVYYVENLGQQYLYTVGTFSRLNLNVKLPEGILHLKYTLSDGTVYTIKNAYKVVSTPVVYMVMDADEAFTEDTGIATDQMSDYVSLFVYGYNLKDNVVPTFYDSNSAVISGDVEAYETGDWGTFYRVAKKDSSEWNIPNTDSVDEKRFTMEIESAENVIDLREDHFIDIDRQDVYWFDYNSLNQTFTAWISEGIDIDSSSVPTLVFQDYSNGSHTNVLTVEGTYDQFENSLTGVVENRILFKVTESQLETITNMNYHYYTIYFGDEVFVSSDLPSVNHWRHFSLNATNQTGMISSSGTKDFLFYLPYWVGGVYKTSGTAANGYYYLTDSDVNALKEQKASVVRYSNGQGSLASGSFSRGKYQEYIKLELPDAPVGKPNVIITSVGDDGFKLTWNTIDGANLYSIDFYEETYGLAGNITTTSSTQFESSIEALCELNEMFYELYYISMETGQPLPPLHLTVTPIAVDGYVKVYGTASDAVTYDQSAPSTPDDSKEAFASGRPLFVSFHVTEKKASFTWQDYDNATEYQVYRKVGTGEYVRVEDSLSSTIFTDLNVLPGKAYTYKVRAVNDEWDLYSNFSEEITLTPELDSPEITNVQTWGYNNIKVTWSEIQNADGYRLYYKDPESGKKTYITQTSDTSYVHANRVTGQTYTYYVRAYRKLDGSYGFSDYSEAKTGKAVPRKAAISSAKSYSYNKTKIIWNKVAGATGYRLYVQDNGGPWQYVKQTADTSYIHTGLTTGHEYTYYVRAYRTVNGTKVYGAYSAAATAKPIPNKTKWASASSTASTATVKWNKVSGATGYRVYCKTADSSWKLLKEVSSSTLSYKHTKLESKKTYNYRVRAFRKVDGVRVFGTYSTIKPLTTK